MDIGKFLTAEARYLVQTLQGQTAALQAELREIERRKGEIETQCSTAALAPERLRNYEPGSGANFECPRCWIQKEMRTPLRPVAVAVTASDDIFRCPNCLAEFLIPAR
jgi:hypothetical protein